MLKADIGKPQLSDSGCGKLHNVRYTLRYAVLPQARMERSEVRDPIGLTWTAQSGTAGAVAIQLVAKGHVGDCASNIFVEMGAALRQQMTGEVRIVDSADRFYEDDPRFEKLRTDWVHPEHALNSDVYYSNRRECLRESRIVLEGSGDVHHEGEQFEVCMASFGWRPQ